MILAQSLRRPNSRLPLDNQTDEYNAKNHVGISH